MKVITAINAGREIRTGANYTDNTIMGWLSTLDQQLALEAGEGIESAVIPIEANQAVYDMPSGFTWGNIIKLWIDDMPVQKLNAMGFGKAGVMLIDDKLSIYPVPVKAGRLRILQQKLREAYTDKANDDLYLQDPYADAYKWYVAAQMYLYDRDMDFYNNMILLYNQAIENYEKRKAITGTTDRLVVTNLW